jgi:hypothetical protein
MTEQEYDLTPRAYRPLENSRRMQLLAADQAPTPGDHLVTPFMGFAHHGIYVGDGRVVHYNARVYDIVRKPVEETTLETFADGRPVYVIKHSEAPFEAEYVVKRARARIGENHYRLMTNNCEHFVEWCLHGEHRSFQVELALRFPRYLGGRIQQRIAHVAHRVLGWRRLRIGAPPKQ